jgi:superfamily I DNA/RNA helicase
VKANSSRLAVGTFHSIALGQIRRNNLHGLGRLISEGERLSLIRRCWKQHAKRHSLESVIQAIDASKSRVDWKPSESPSIMAALATYGELLKAEGAIDFADLMLKAVRDMHSKSMPPLSVRWLLVDEAQDMDEIQIEWVKIHARQGIDVTLVGDDDQSLYSFRHATGYAGLLHISEFLSSAIISLPINYRSPDNIVQHANRLISHNVNRAPKSIEANRKTPGAINVMRVADRWSEAELIASRIGSDEDIDSWAILGRTNSILDKVEIAFVERTLPYIRLGGKSVWEKTVGSTLLGLLHSVAAGTWTGIANTLFYCGMAPTVVNDISLIRPEILGIERLDAIIQNHLGSIDSSADRDLLIALHIAMRGWDQQARLDRPVLVIHAVTAWLAGRAAGEDASLLQRLEGILCRMTGRLLNRLVTVQSRRQSLNGGAAIMTMHAAKGLEFPNVWILGAEEGSLPHADATEEEERRLFYVGMTRTKGQLIVSSAADEGPVSRFVAEADLHRQR